MAVYKFRVTFEDYDDIYRDIEVKPTQTFEELHKTIQDSIGFDGSHEASFFMSDDMWKKGQEITLMSDSKKLPLMKKARLCDYIIDPHQKIYYIYDFNTVWAFYIELIRILPNEDSNAAYPRCIKKVGDAPKQYGATALGAALSEFDFLNESELDTEESEVKTHDEAGEETEGATEEGSEEFSNFDPSETQDSEEL